jgi:protein phosphatase
LTGVFPSPFLQEPPGQSDWSWFLLVSSPIVVIILILIIVILLLLMMVWLRAKETPQEKPPPTLPSAPAPRDQAKDTVPSPSRQEDSTLIEEAPTIPSQADETDDPTKTKPSPMRAGPAAATLVKTSEPETSPQSGQRPANIGWQIAGLTDVGLKRDLNEDAFLMVEAAMPDGTPYGLYVVADGLGGHHAGEVASQITIDEIHKSFQQDPPPTTAAPFEEWLRSATLAANEAVLARQPSHEQAKKMVSTLVMALVLPGQAHIANVGDSRAYHLTSETVEQISVDHSLVERLVQIGQLSREEARQHKNRNVIYNTIGDKKKIEVGLYHRSLQSGDRLLLCSDGLSGLVTDENLLSISQNQPEPARACQVMVEAAKAAGGTDNITAIIVQMDE